MQTDDFDYTLPEGSIAQTPLEPRDSARLLVYHRDSRAMEHAIFRDLPGFLDPGDVLVLNETRVLRARLSAHKIPGGGKVEIFLLRQVDPLTWEALVGGKGLTAGKRVQVDQGPEAVIQTVLEGSLRLVRFENPIETELDRIGAVPLPPYIHETLRDPERYQTVYSREIGSVAAPTAGLHFTSDLFARLHARGVLTARLTLHVGLDTFAPVTEADPRQHVIHTEWRQLDATAAETINTARLQGKRIVSVGTTSLRTLESAAAPPAVQPVAGPTSLFILPGYRFQAADALITNFHLPRSTLIMLVSAFAGRENVLALYQTAIELGYRFYSFGDAVLFL